MIADNIAPHMNAAMTIPAKASETHECNS